MPAIPFPREVIDINLRRIPWLLVVSMALAVWPLAAFWHDPELAALRTVLLVDLVGAGLFLALNIPVRCLSKDSRWRDAYVWVTVVLALAFMDVYYFTAAGSFGTTPLYILGTVLAGTLFLLPPGSFLPVLAVNHLAFCAASWWWFAADAGLDAVLIQNTTGVSVAGLVSGLLYRAHREESQQRRALAEANQFLLRRNEQLNELMAITAHDLRAPLLGMRDLLGLAGKATDGARRLEMVGRVAGECTELIGLVDRLLRAHVAERQMERPLTVAPADLRPVVSRALQRVQPRTRARGIELGVSLPDHPAVAPFDAKALERVLDNVLFNAAKFVPRGGAIEVRVHREQGRWCCDVTDNGPGIPSGDRGRLFQKFHRGSAISGPEEGSGLGLYIAATLMKAMGGDIEHRLARPQGAAFRLVFGTSTVSSARPV